MKAGIFLGKLNLWSFHFHSVLDRKEGDMDVKKTGLKGRKNVILV
jgi:hypothetical protein